MNDPDPYLSRRGSRRKITDQRSAEALGIIPQETPAAFLGLVDVEKWRTALKLDFDQDFIIPVPENGQWRAVARYGAHDTLIALTPQELIDRMREHRFINRVGLGK
jgi:hypothetical protein